MKEARVAVVAVVIVVLAASAVLRAQTPQNSTRAETSTTATHSVQPPVKPVSTIQPSDLTLGERYELEKLKLERDLEKDLLERLQTRFWIIVALTVLVGFFGVRALVREMISAELRDAMRATAQAQAAAEQTRDLTKGVREAADAYKGLVDGLGRSAADVDTRFKELQARIAAEGAHAVASSELQFKQLAQRVEELAGTLKSVASETQDSKSAIKQYEERLVALNSDAAASRAQFTENSRYDIEVVHHHNESAEVSAFANGLLDELRKRGYRTSEAFWTDTYSTDFVRVDVEHGAVAEEMLDHLVGVIQLVEARHGMRWPVRRHRRDDMRALLDRSAVIFFASGSA